MATVIHTDDWKDYLSVDGLAAVSGVAKEHHIPLMVKEIVDNALDASGRCDLGLVRDRGFYVQDYGPGIPGVDEEIAYLFSISRKTFSTKGERYPRRGAMGRGLRFVAGEVFCYATTLKVSTGGRMLLLKPEDNGTRCQRMGEYHGPGTRIEVEFHNPISDADLQWGRLAIQMARGEDYAWYSSPWWYDAHSLYVLLKSIQYDNEKKISQVLKDLFGRFTLKGLDVGVQNLLNQKSADDFSLVDAGLILEALRKAHAKGIKPQRLGYVGEVEGFPYYYTLDGHYEHRIQNGKGEILKIPYVLELWAKPTDTQENVTLFVNKTPVATPPVRIYVSKKSSWLSSNGMNLSLDIGILKRRVSFYLNIITPFLPRTGNAKMPMIPSKLRGAVQDVLEKAVKKINRDKILAGPSRPKGGSLEAVPAEMRARVETLQKKAQQGIDAFFQREGLVDHKYLNVLSSDPFLVGKNLASAAMAVWFVDIWSRLNPDGKTIHLRRLHYQIVSQPEKVKKHDGKSYENTHECWAYLLTASKYARELELIDPLGIIDRRNPEPYDPVSYTTSFEGNYETDFPPWHIPQVDLAGLRIGEIPMPDVQIAYEYSSALQPAHLEIWTEKTTMNDILKNICDFYGILLIPNTGYASITNIERFLRQRALPIEKPSVIFYISDYDEAGENMPVMVSRTLQHRIVNLKERGAFPEGKEISVQPIILTKEQMHSVEFRDLPKAPAKLGIGRVTELDALEAMLPGKFQEIVEKNIEMVFDRKIIDDMPAHVELAKEKYKEALDFRISHLVTEAEAIQQMFEEITKKHEPYLREISDALQEEILPYQERLSAIREMIAGHAEEAMKEAKIDIATDKQPLLENHLFLSSRSFTEQTNMLLKYRTFKKEQ